jgi:hypothetical protein
LKLKESFLAGLRGFQHVYTGIKEGGDEYISSMHGRVDAHQKILFGCLRK